MCRCAARGITACFVCLGMILSPLGAKNPSAAVIGHILAAPSSGASIATASVGYSIPSTVTGAVHRWPTELPRPAVHEPDERLS